MVIEDLVVYTLQLRSVIVEAFSFDQFSPYFRLPIQLQLDMDPKSLVPNDHCLVHLLYRVPAVVILVIRGTLCSNNHTRKEVVSSVVILGTL